MVVRWEIVVVQVINETGRLDEWLKASLLGWEVSGSISEPVKPNAVGSPPLRRRCIAQTLCLGDRARHLLHVSP